MAASAKRRKAKAEPETESFVSRGADAVGAFVARNPASVAGSTGFIVALLYVSANALWYQPHAHTGPLFATRAFESFISPDQMAERSEPQTTIRIERPVETPTPAPAPRLADPMVERVQRILADMNFYSGEIDGRKGPGTRKAIEAYQRKMGLKATGSIDQELLEQLGASDVTGSVTASDAAEPDQAAPAGGGNELVAGIQKGLRAFGVEGIEVDGLMGARTRAGIKEFQSMFGMDETGEPDEALLAKMQEENFVQ